jgi:hypothetical protein
MSLKIYLAQAMTGRFCDEILAEAREASAEFAKYGIPVWSPALEEGLPDKHVKLTSTDKEDLMAKWEVDKKEGLRSCHIIYDATGDMKSEGVGIERGHMRWYLWRPVIRRKDAPHYFSISHIEEDGIVYTHRQAAAYVNKKWNSRRKWIMWKLPHLFVGIPKLIYLQIASLFLWHDEVKHDALH